jgi:hypothetical protein
MKRAIKIVLFVALVFAATAASAQFGVKLGYVSTQNKLKGGGDSESIKQIGLLAGVNYDIALSDGGLSIRPGVNYLLVGGGSGDESEIDHTLAIPIDLKWAFELGYEMSVYALVGPKLSMGIGFNNDIYGDAYKEKIYNRFDLQLGLGAGAQLGSFSFEIGYDIGMMNRIHKDILGDSDASFKRNQLVLSVGYHF